MLSVASGTAAWMRSRTASISRWAAAGSTAMYASTATDPSATLASHRPGLLFAAVLSAFDRVRERDVTQEQQHERRGQQRGDDPDRERAPRREREGLVDGSDDGRDEGLHQAAERLRRVR